MQQNVSLVNGYPQAVAGPPPPAGGSTGSATGNAASGPVGSAPGLRHASGGLEADIQAAPGLLAEAQEEHRAHTAAEMQVHQRYKSAAGVSYIHR